MFNEPILREVYFCERVVAQCKERTELFVGSGPAGGHDHLSRDARRDTGTGSALYERKRKIDPRGDACARRYSPVENKEAIWLDEDARKGALQLVDSLPVCGRTAPVEQSGSGEREGAHAHRSYGRACFIACAQPMRERSHRPVAG